MFKNKKIILGVGLFAILIFILPTILALAVEDYTVLAPLPGVGDDGGTTNLQKYVPAVFKLAIGISAVAAVLMIVLGGFQYISTDAIQKKSEGKERIKNAIFGLVLVISAWLILNEINPNLLNINLNIEPVTTTSTTGGTLSKEGVAMTDAQIAESNSIKTSLEKKDVWTYKGPCTEGQTTQCVNLNGLSETLKDDLISLNSNCDKNISGGCNVIITGGTESGHSKNSLHNTGNAVDLRTDAKLTEYIVTNAKGDPVQTDYGMRYTLEIDGKTVYFLDESNHWHVSTGSGN